MDWYFGERMETNRAIEKVKKRREYTTTSLNLFNTIAETLQLVRCLTCKYRKLENIRPSLHFYGMIFWWKKGSLHRNGMGVIPKNFQLPDTQIPETIEYWLLWSQICVIFSLFNQMFSLIVHILVRYSDATQKTDKHVSVFEILLQISQFAQISHKPDPCVWYSDGTLSGMLMPFEYKTIWQSYKLFFYQPSSGIASCVGTAGTVTWCLHLMRPCCVALGRVLIWVVSPDWFEELCQLGFLIPK